MPSFGDFAHDKDAQQQRKLRQEYNETLQECRQMVCRGLSLAATGHENITSFEIVTSIGKILSVDSYRSEQDLLLQASFVEYQWGQEDSRKNSSGTGYCIVGLPELRKTYPITYIHKDPAGQDRGLVCKGRYRL